MPRGGIKELREMQAIAQSKTDKVYEGYPKTKQEWIHLLEEWLEPELTDIISLHGKNDSLVKSLLEQKKYKEIHNILEHTWCSAPDDISIHSEAGWEVLCDLCSESYLLND